MLSVEKPGTPEELAHVGVKGMKWGVRNVRTSGPTSSKVANWSINSHYARASSRTERRKAQGKTGPKPVAKSIRSVQGMSKKKKIAIGVGVGIAVVGGAVIAGHVLGSRGKIRISDIDGGKDNLIRLKNGKGAISTLSHEQWATKISNAKASFNMQSAAAKSIAARRKAGHPGYRPGELLGKPATIFNDAAAYPRRG